MIDTKYYYENPKYEKLFKRHITLWNGHLQGNNEKWLKKEDYSKFNDIIVDTCECNFYIHLDENNLYLSVDADTEYYHYDFEKGIFKLIKRLEKEFDIFIDGGEFFAIECKHSGSQFKYTIYRDNKENNKIKLKKKVLNITKV